MSRRTVVLPLLALAWATVDVARAQPRPPPDAPRSPLAFGARFGATVATRLLRSTDPDERLRGIERASSTRAPEFLALLEHAAGAIGPGGIDPRSPLDGAARIDPRALLTVVRGLATWIDHESARSALAAIVAAPESSLLTPAGTPIDASRVLLARQQAALALAASENTLSIEALVAIGRSGGPGQEPALDALSIKPPRAPLVLGGVALTTPATVALAIAVADLRALDAVVGAAGASDPTLRATAITGLGNAGDVRGAELARTAVHDRDPRVRVAAAGALLRLGVADAPPAIEALVADDATALDGLALAQEAQGEGITRAAAARALATADPTLRSMAVTVLGRQTCPSAVHALETLLGDSALQGDVAYALARSPGPAALEVIEEIAAATGTRRLAARAYFVRRYVRGDRSARLDGLLAALARSSDARDRAVGLQALVTFGERTFDDALSDPDWNVRGPVRWRERHG